MKKASSRRDGLEDLADDDDRLSDFDRVLCYLKREFHGFDYDPDRDFHFFLTLFSDFEDLDIFDELKHFYAWVLDQGSEQTIHFRCRFRTWLQHSRAYRFRHDRESR